ncbi:T9SS type A sorting domain-containing protein [Hymenobacter gummosus]|uniref:T9SS type A sorting domain-containing protein n=1 Tax=Hymenobacter gummosus TaxID=1776032 RepID=A0A431U116_9BACT|nr:T9SS type A sorting domain-containing protein [Hymenobacter gummosus]RTQ48593.1 T9SS type A sorting domain-containing protein [Hymenobacter gummosus]
MRPALLLVLLLLLSWPVTAQRLVRDRIYPNSIYAFGRSVLTPQNQVLTALFKRHPQMPGFFGRAVFLNRQLDTTTTLQRVYNLAPGIPGPGPAGGYIYAYGEPSSDTQDATLRRYRSDMTLRWQRRYDLHPGYQEGPTGLVSTADAHFLSIYSFAPGNRRRNVVLKVDTAGAPLWQRNYGWSGTDFILDMQRTRQGNLLLYGITADLGSGRIQIKLLELTQSGDSVQGRRIAPPGVGRNIAVTGTFADNILQLTDGGYLCTIGLDSVNRPNIPLAVKVDAQLRPVWTRVERYGPPRTSGAAARYGNAVELAYGSVLVLCYYEGTPVTEDRPFYLLRLDGATGQLLQRHEFRSTICNRMAAFQLLADGDSAAYVLGLCSAGPGGASVQAPYAARLSLRGLPAIVTAATPRPAADAAAGLGQPYPNPATAAVRVPYRRAAGTAPATVQLFDALGRRVRLVPVPAAPSGQVELQLTGLAAGVYWLRYEQGGTATGPGRQLLVQP